MHEHQRGFVAGKSTLHNIHDVVRLIKNFQGRVTKSIRKGTPKHKRPQHFLIFLDLAKAFDSINRSTLVTLLYEKEVNTTLVNAIRSIYSQTYMHANGMKEPTVTARGVM